MCKYSTPSAAVQLASLQHTHSQLAVSVCVVFIQRASQAHLLLKWRAWSWIESLTIFQNSSVTAFTMFRVDN